MAKVSWLKHKEDGKRYTFYETVSKKYKDLVVCVVKGKRRTFTVTLDNEVVASQIQSCELAIKFAERYYI